MTTEIDDLVGPAIIQVVAPWCSACKAMRPDFDAVAADYAGRIDVMTLDAAQEGAAVGRLGIMGTPTVVGIRDGTELLRFTGRRTPAELREIFESVAAGGVPSAVGRQDTYLRLGAGIALIGIGLVIGPAWPLVGVGAVVLGAGAYSLRTNRPNDVERGRWSSHPKN